MYLIPKYNSKNTAQQDVLFPVLWLVQHRNVSNFFCSLSNHFPRSISFNDKGLRTSDQKKLETNFKSIIITPVELVKTQLQVQTNNLKISEYVTFHQLIAMVDHRLKSRG